MCHTVVVHDDGFQNIVLTNLLMISGFLIIFLTFLDYAKLKFKNLKIITFSSYNLEFFMAF